MNSTLPVILCIVCSLMSLVSLILMALDKSFAKSRSRRIPEKTLFLFAILFGAPGGVLGMQLFRHKTRHSYFAIGFPLFAVLQIALILAAFYFL